MRQSNMKSTLVIRAAAALCCIAMALALAFGSAPLFGCNDFVAYADEEHSKVAKATVTDMPESEYTPISGTYVTNGTYDVEFVTNSKYFKIEKAQLTADDGKLTATLTMSSHSYLLLFMGTGDEAAAAKASKYIEPEKDLAGNCTFTIPVPSLNAGFDCAAFSKKKEKWYDRRIMALASSLPKGALTVNAADFEGSGENANDPESKEGNDNSTSNENNVESIEVDGVIYGSAEGNTAFDAADPMDIDLPDGEYSIGVNLAGGSGRATVSSPTLLIVKDGKAYARLLWSSSYYDYMIVGGQTYLNETTDGGNSSFTIPVSSTDRIIPIIADTTAMGDPVAIEYSLVFYEETIGDKGLIPQEATKKVLTFAIIIIVVGAILNFIIKRKTAV